MCAGAVDLAQAAIRFGAPRDWYHPHRGDLNALMADGLLWLNDDVLTLTAQGAPVIRVVASVFDAYLSQNLAKHAVAV
jgi:oxygen-independent coproporphyrinogen-3 oxidase